MPTRNTRWRRRYSRRTRRRRRCIPLRAVTWSIRTHGTSRRHALLPRRRIRGRVERFRTRLPSSRLRERSIWIGTLLRTRNGTTHHRVARVWHGILLNRRGVGRRWCNGRLGRVMSGRRTSNGRTSNGRTTHRRTTLIESSLRVGVVRLLRRRLRTWRRTVRIPRVRRLTIPLRRGLRRWCLHRLHGVGRRRVGRRHWSRTHTAKSVGRLNGRTTAPTYTHDANLFLAIVSATCANKDAPYPALRPCASFCEKPHQTAANEPDRWTACGTILAHHRSRQCSRQEHRRKDKVSAMLRDAS